MCISELGCLWRTSGRHSKNVSFYNRGEHCEPPGDLILTESHIPGSVSVSGQRHASADKSAVKRFRSWLLSARRWTGKAVFFKGPKGQRNLTCQKL